MAFNIVDENEDALPDGNKKIFEFLFRKYYTMLCYFANSILHDEHEAKDTVQNCFARLWNKKIIRPETIKSFLFTIVRNECVDILRRRKTTLNIKNKLSLTEAETDFDFFDEAAFADMVRQVVDKIDELPPKMQQIFKMYFLEGKKYKRIAADLNVSSESVRKQKERALKILRDKLRFDEFLFPFIRRIALLFRHQAYKVSP